jgi:DNA-binding protein HU-beta
MNKQELIEKLETKTKVTLTHADLERLVNGFMDEIKAAVAAGESVQLVGFGTFEARTRAARTARNPKTGEALTVAAKKAPVFKAGKAFKDAVNK